MLNFVGTVCTAIKEKKFQKIFVSCDFTYDFYYIPNFIFIFFRIIKSIFFSVLKCLWSLKKKFYFFIYFYFLYNLFLRAFIFNLFFIPSQIFFFLHSFIVCLFFVSKLVFSLLFFSIMCMFLIKGLRRYFSSFSLYVSKKQY